MRVRARPGGRAPSLDLLPAHLTTLGEELKPHFPRLPSGDPKGWPKDKASLKPPSSVSVGTGASSTTAICTHWSHNSCYLPSCPRSLSYCGNWDKQKTGKGSPESSTSLPPMCKPLTSALSEGDGEGAPRLKTGLAGGPGSTEGPHSSSSQWPNCPSVQSSPPCTLQHLPHQNLPSPGTSGAGAGGWKPKQAQQEASPDWGHTAQPMVDMAAGSASPDITC